MKFGLSLYDALSSYVGENGARLSGVQFTTLMSLVNRYTQIAQTRKVLARLDRPMMVLDMGGTYFLDSSQQALADQLEGNAYVLEADDTLSHDRFFIVDDNTLPFILVARSTDNGANYQVLISIDHAMIDGARAILGQYGPNFMRSAMFEAPRYHTAGNLLGHIVYQFGRNIASSWLEDALDAHTKEQTERLACVQRALNAVWINWKGLVLGQRPAREVGYQHQRITGDDGEVFEVIGPDGDDFAKRCYACVGLLAAFDEIEQPVQPELDFLKNFSLEDFIADIESDFGLQDDSEPTPGLSESLPTTSQAHPAAASHLQNGKSATDVAPTAPNTSVSLPSVSNNVLRYVGHQINTLRDNILDSGIIQELKTDTRSVMQHFVNASSDLLLLIDEIIYMQQVTEQIRQDRQQLDVGMLVNALVMTYASEAERRGVTLMCDLADDLPEILGNAEALNRALMIMVERSLDATEGKGRVELDVLLHDRYLELVTRDNGEVLSKEARRKLFIPDFSGQGTMGQSLGFATVKAIAEAHGGRVQIREEKGMNLVALQLRI